MAYTPATEELIRALQGLPGVGSRSAARMALHLLERDTESAQSLSVALSDALTKVHRCPSCRTLTEQPVCAICDDAERDSTRLCVVVNDADRAAIEMSKQFQGHYFVLHGVLSPMEGVGPEQLAIFDLLDKLRAGTVSEVIFALDEQMESEATVYYITEQLKSVDIQCSRMRFAHLKNGHLDQAESRYLVNAMAQRQEILVEQG